VNMEGQRDRSFWEMWRRWDEAESGLHVQGPQDSSRIRVCRDTAILLGRCEERDGLIEQQKRYAPVQGSCAGGKRSW
jgi:hypothetical protein